MFQPSHSFDVEDVTTMPHPGLTLRTIGGILEFFVFLGPTPEEVIQQYTSVIGRTFMPPYWSLGFQISRWGYANTEEIRAVVDRTRRANIPQVNTINFYESLDIDIVLELELSTEIN